jgi:hypothetical protein
MATAVRLITFWAKLVYASLSWSIIHNFRVTDPPIVRYYTRVDFPIRAVKK